MGGEGEGVGAGERGGGGTCPVLNGLHPPALRRRFLTWKLGRGPNWPTEMELIVSCPPLPVAAAARVSG